MKYITLFMAGIIIFSGCSTIPAGDSGLLKTRCLERLTFKNMGYSGYYVGGEISKAFVPIDHPDVGRLFSYDISAKNAYDEYISANNALNGVAIGGVCLLALLTEVGLIINPPSAKVELIMLDMLLPTTIFGGVVSIIGLGMQLSKDSNLEKAISLYKLSCKF